MCQIKAYLLVLNTGSGAVLSPGVSGPVTSTRHVHPAGLKPKERCGNTQSESSEITKKVEITNVNDTDVAKIGAALSPFGREAPGHL